MLIVDLYKVPGTYVRARPCSQQHQCEMSFTISQTFKDLQLNCSSAYGGVAQESSERLVVILLNVFSKVLAGSIPEVLSGITDTN